MGSRREQALVVALLLIVALLATLAAPDADRSSWDPRPSSFRISPRGARALYLTLREMGIPTEQRLTPYVDADSLAGPLVLLAPSQPPSPAEIGALARWVERGGTLIYAARPGDPTLDTLGLTLRPTGEDTLNAWMGSGVDAVRGNWPWTAGVDILRGVRWSFAPESPALRDGRAAPLFVTPDGGAAAVLFRRGEGWVAAWSDPAPLSNAELRGSGAATVFARLAAAATDGERPLRFDEYHHGYRGGGSAVGGTLRFLRDTPLGHAALQLALAGAGLLLLAGRRFGAPHPPAPAARRSPLEHVDALAGAYRQAGARGTARRLLLAGLARRTGRVPPRGAGEQAELLRRLGSHAGVNPETAQRLHTEWERGERADLVALARETDHLMEEMKRT